MVKYACPQWIIDLWITSYGRERALELVENLTGRPPLAVRVNSCKTTREALTERLKEEGVETKEVPGVEQALTLERSGSIESLSSFQNGFFTYRIWLPSFAVRCCLPSRESGFTTYAPRREEKPLPWRS